jgi:hypothetical protein
MEMKINIEPYRTSIQNLPVEGQHIVAHQAGDEIVVYQAYKKGIADFAVKHQQLGGSEYSYNRMSWIKPNFLWMMFRCGWAEKENQERVLAIWIDKKDFDKLLQQAVLSTYNHHYYDNHDTWKSELETKEVRLQWDPDHNPHGNKITRRALQLGIKGRMLEQFGKKDIKLIEDVTDFVKEGGAFVKTNQLDKLLVPLERVYKPVDAELCTRIGID